MSDMTKFKSLKPNDVLSETQFYKVQKIVGDKVQLLNDHNQPIIVDLNYVESCLMSADQYEKTEKVSRTQATEIFLSNPETAMTVVFHKQVQEKDVLAEMLEAHQNSTPKEVEAAFKKAIKKALNGERRELTGYHWKSQDEYGRVHMVDMNVEKETGKSYDTRQRLVDPRTIESVTVKNVKYIVK